MHTRDVLRRALETHPDRREALAGFADLVPPRLQRDVGLRVRVRAGEASSGRERGGPSARGRGSEGRESRGGPETARDGTWSRTSAIPEARARDSSACRVEPMSSPSFGLEAETCADVDAKPPARVLGAGGRQPGMRERGHGAPSTGAGGVLVSHDSWRAPCGGMGAETSPLSATLGLNEGNHACTLSLLFVSRSAARAACSNDFDDHLAVCSQRFDLASVNALILAKKLETEK